MHYQPTTQSPPSDRQSRKAVPSIHTHRQRCNAIHHIHDLPDIDVEGRPSMPAGTLSTHGFVDA